MRINPYFIIISSLIINGTLALGITSAAQQLLDPYTFDIVPWYSKNDTVNDYRFKQERTDKLEESRF